jgi:hypothetical protein
MKYIILYIVLYIILYIVLYIILYVILYIMSSKMSMMFSQNVGFTGKISRRPITMPGVVSGPLFISLPARSPVQQQPQTRQRQVASSVASTSRSAAPARNVKQLFNMGNIMSNPGAPCGACGS